jgi:hypothetical protein
VRLFRKAAREGFLVVGAYPPTGTYDECTTSEHLTRALKTISKVGRPRKDPLYGNRRTAAQGLEIGTLARRNRGLSRPMQEITMSLLGHRHMARGERCCCPSVEPRNQKVPAWPP